MKHDDLNPQAPEPPPPISFVVPAFNEEALIASCLYAILAEVSRVGCAAEIIVVDNNSSDHTREIAAGIPGVAIVEELRRGLVAARRAGCLAARGRLIANIDADTMIPPGWLDIVLGEFDRHPRLAALSGPFIHYDLPKSARLAAAVFYRISFVGYLLVRFVFRAGSMMQGGNFVVRKRALEAADAFSPSFSFYGEDTEMARRLSEVGPVKFSLAFAGLFLRPAARGRRGIARRGPLQHQLLMGGAVQTAVHPGLARFSPSDRRRQCWPRWGCGGGQPAHSRSILVSVATPPERCGRAAVRRYRIRLTCFSLSGRSPGAG